MVKLQNVLGEYKIPFYFKKSASGIENESDYMKVFELAIRLIINNKDLIHLRDLQRIVGSQKSVNSSTATGYEILEEALDGSKFSTMLTSLKTLQNEPLDFNNCIRMIEANLTFSDDEEKYLVLNDISQWKRHWKNYCRQVQHENRTLVSFRNYISLGKTQDIDSNHGIALLSAHMSKGLQFDVVFVMGLSEGTFPDYRAVRIGGNQMEQEKNNMYVAVTRAKRLCYLTYPKRKMMPWGDEKAQTPSRFIQSLLFR